MGKIKKIEVFDYLYIINNIETDNEEIRGDLIKQNINNSELKKSKFISNGKLQNIIDNLNERKEEFTPKKKNEIVKIVFKNKIFSKLLEFGEETNNQIFKLIINEDSSFGKLLKENSLDNLNREGVLFIYEKINELF